MFSTSVLKVYLPSRGLPYPNNPELKEAIKCRAITSAEEVSIFNSTTLSFLEI